MQYYTVKQLSKMLSCSEDTVRRKITAGEFGDTLNDGKTHKVSDSGLMAYIERHTGPANYVRNFSTPKPHRRKNQAENQIRRLTLEDLRGDSA